MDLESDNKDELNCTFLITFLGNNIYGSEICDVLQGVKGSTERTAYILMDKIHPAPVQNYLLRRDAPLTISSCLSELGAFGTFVRCVTTLYGIFTSKCLLKHT